MDGEEPTRAGTGRSGKRRRRRKAAVSGAIGTIVVGVLVNALTGVFTTAVNTLWSLLAGDTPLQVHSAVFSGCGGGAWVVPKGTRATPPPDAEVSDEEEIRAWQREAGAVRLNETKVELTLRGGSSDSIVLQRLRVRVVERRPPLQATRVPSRPCGGPIAPRMYDADLDEAQPTAAARVHANQETPPVSFPYAVTRGDPEVIRLTARTEACDCSWVIELVYVDGEERHVMRIDDLGVPFRTTAAFERTER